MTDDLIEVHADVRGATAPADHYYLLHSCIKTQCCRRLTERGWQLRLIQGGERDGDLLRFDRGPDASLMMRLPEDDLEECLALHDTTFQLGDHFLAVDSPQVQPIRPVPNLVADCVHISHDERGSKGLNRGNLGAGVGKRLGAQFGHLNFGIVVEEHISWDVKGTTLHGNRVRVLGLDDDESLWLQRHGLGEKNSWGCGTFWPE